MDPSEFNLGPGTNADDGNREPNMPGGTTGGATPAYGLKSPYRRKEIMENFRMRILRNLDLATEIALEEGLIVLKKYDDLNFYLTEIANGRIIQLKTK